MHTATTFGWRHTLNAMAASFVFQLFESFAFDFDGNLKIARVRGPLPNDAVLSTLTVDQTHVGGEKVFDEKLGICPTFSGANFDNSLHDFSPVTQKRVTFHLCPKIGSHAI